MLAAALLAIALGMANYIALLRLKPEVSAIAWIADKPDYESHLVNINQRALSRAKGAPDSFLPIYDVQNPGFFLLVAELYARAGAVTPLPLEISSIVLFNLGALFFFGWVYLLFSSPITAAFATAFLALSQFFLFFPGVTHTMPYEFVFFNLTLLLYLGFLRSGYRAYFFGALLAMFLTCMNYWFYYMSSWIIMVGLWWQYRGRPAIRDIAAISAPPIAALVFTAGMVIALYGIRPGIMRLLDILVARTFDVRIPGGHWYPDQHFMDAQAWAIYPDTVMYRLQWAYSIDTFWFVAAAGCTFVLLGFRDRRALVSALILLLGGMSWYYVMFQHTHIHHFVGQYSFMAICPIFGLMVSETMSSFRRAGRGLAAMLGLWTAKPDLMKKRSMAGQASGKGWPSVVVNLAVATVMAGVGWKMTYPYAATTYGLIRDTVHKSTVVEAKYRQAVQSICHDKGQVTLTDLQAASKDWGFEWRPSIIADTNRLPRCAG